MSHSQRNLAVVHKKVSHERTSLSVRVTPEFLARIDAWRRQQEVIPTRATAARILLAIGLLYKDEQEQPDGQFRPSTRGT